MFTVEEGIKAVKAARAVSEAEVQGKQAIPELPPSFSSDGSGIFVTLNEYPSGRLRACIGFPVALETADRTLIQAARAVCYDERFPPLKLAQAQKCVFEVTFLTPPEKIQYGSPEELKNQIEIGRDGLMMKYARNTGLTHSAVYLPQVPAEQGWNTVEYLENICMKAGLQADSWKSGVLEFYRFGGEVFGETSPNGEIVKK